MLSLATTAVYGATVRAASAYGRKANISAWISAPAAIIVVSWPMSLIVARVITTFNPRLRAIVTPLDWYLQTIAVILPVGLAYLAAQYFFSRRVHGTETGSSPAQSDPAPSRTARLSARLSAAIRSDILALQAEDHYVRVHTRAGSELLLMRISDAILELDGLPGTRAHRSWWVSDAAIVSTVRRARRTVHILANGVRVPVSRRAAAEIDRSTRAPNR